MSKLSLATVMLALLAAPASSHVVVTPAASEAGRWERYVVLVPTEKDSPTVKVEVMLPTGMEIVAVEAQPGWEARHEPFPIGAARVRWQGGRIPPGQFIAFEFLAWNPPAARTIEWVATQWYEDGTSERWGGGSGTAGECSSTVLRPGTGKQDQYRHAPAGK